MLQTHDIHATRVERRIGMPASPLPEGQLTFRYFPENYRWSHGLLAMISTAPWGGGEIDEINRVGLRLKQRMGDDSA